MTSGSGGCHEGCTAFQLGFDKTLLIIQYHAFAHLPQEPSWGLNSQTWTHSAYLHFCSP